MTEQIMPVEAEGDIWGSDLIAQALSDLGFEFAAINPGASYRGLHDSLVNYLDEKIALVVCLHEEHAIAMAHGWAKVTDRPALAIVHSNVGLMHATMAVYNAWVDRAPVVLVNASGPRDAVARRPWIDWIHSTQDQGALVRPFTKWDDAPGSAEAAVDALAEAKLLAGMDPKGPTFVCLDVKDQEIQLQRPPRKWRPLIAPAAPVPCDADLDEFVKRLAAASRIVILAGRTSRAEATWAKRLELAERLGAAVITDIKTPAAFPTSHRLAVGAPGFSLCPLQRRVIAEAEVIVALDWIDLEDALRGASGGAFVTAASLDLIATRGFVKNTFRQAVVDLSLPVTADAFVNALVKKLGPGENRAPWTSTADAADARETNATSLTNALVYSEVAEALADLRRNMPITVTRYPLGWQRHLTSFNHPLDYIGRDGGEGLGSGPGIALGVALALKGSGRIPVAIIGDGDFMMGASALWTAASERLPLVIIVAANGVYGNDVVHQERIAQTRRRSVERKWVAQRIDQPRIDIAGLARCQGLEHAVCVSPGEVVQAVRAAAAYARDAGMPALVEIAMTAS